MNVEWLEIFIHINALLLGISILWSVMVLFDILNSVFSTSLITVFHCVESVISTFCEHRYLLELTCKNKANDLVYQTCEKFINGMTM